MILIFQIHVLSLTRFQLVQKGVNSELHILNLLCILLGLRLKIHNVGLGGKIFSFQPLLLLSRFNVGIFSFNLILLDDFELLSEPLNIKIVVQVLGPQSFCLPLKAVDLLSHDLRRLISLHESLILRLQELKFLRRFGVGLLELEKFAPILLESLL